MQVDLGSEPLPLPHPPVVESLLHGDPVLGAEGEHLPDEVLGVVADVLPSGGVEVQLALAYCLVESLLGPQEGESAGEEDVEEDPSGPDVHRLAVRLPQDHLGGHEVRGADPPTIDTLRRGQEDDWYSFSRDE